MAVVQAADEFPNHERKNMRRLTDAEVDALPVHHFPATAERVAYRREWGYGAGAAAFKRGCERTQNPFSPAPGMPMHDSWYAGWDAADKRKNT